MFKGSKLANIYWICRYHYVIIVSEQFSLSRLVQTPPFYSGWRLAISSVWDACATIIFSVSPQDFRNCDPRPFKHIDAANGILLSYFMKDPSDFLSLYVPLKKHEQECLMAELYSSSWGFSLTFCIFAVNVFEF